MDHDMLTDITLDHLPDLSEASVSFQIPCNNASADLLLADQTGGFDLLYNAVDEDMTFAPLAPRYPRGPPLVLGELTPRAEATPRPPLRSQSCTPTHVPSSSTKPPAIQYPLTLGRRSSSPDKHGKTPCRTQSVHRRLESPLVSSERFDRLRAELEMLDPLSEASSPVRMQFAEDGSVDCKSLLSCAEPKLKKSALRSHRAVDRLDSVPEEKDAFHDAETRTKQDVAMPTDANRAADATHMTAHLPRPESKRHPRTVAKPTIAAPGVSDRPVYPGTHVLKKAKSKPSVREAQPVLPVKARQFTPPQSIATVPEGQLVPPVCMGGDIEAKSENTQITHPSTGGMTERLVSYSQMLISSIGLPRPWTEFTERSDDPNGIAKTRAGTQPVADTQPLFPQSIGDAPSTYDAIGLSDISPHISPQNSPKPCSTAGVGIPQDSAQHAVSSMRLAKKRVSMDADLPQEQGRQPKRGRTMPISVDGHFGSDEPVAQPHPHQAGDGNQPLARFEAQNNSQRPSGSTLPSARTKYRPKLDRSAQCKGPTLDAFPYLSYSRRALGAFDKSKGKRDEGKHRAPARRSGSSLSGLSASDLVRQDKRRTRSSQARQPSDPSTSADLPLREKKQNATLFVAPPTQTAGFTFPANTRLEARQVDQGLAASEPGKTYPLHAVPDLKPLQASHQAAPIFQKESIVPSVTAVPFVFCTEQRAKEREKFDAMIRRKEEDMQRLKEEQRRREEEEEERMIKELRRKAIPKANDVPEWYAGMPKRKGTVVRH